MNRLIEVTEVSKVYKNGNIKFFALKDITFSIAAQEYISIIGPSGAGKSTLLHLLGGLDYPSRGQYFCDGVNISTLSNGARALWRNKRIGFVFQFYHLIEELNVFENVLLPSMLAGIKREISLIKVRKLLQYLDIESKAKNVPSQLSGGEKQKVAIARALVNDPQIILCDEPTGNLDEESAEKVIQLLERLHTEESKTVIIVTHNNTLAARTNRVIHLQNGRMVSSDI